MLTLDMAVSGEDSADKEHDGVWRTMLTSNMAVSVEDYADIGHGCVWGGLHCH